MANEEHLAILKQGVEKRNKWRDENPEIRPDLSGTYLDGKNLSYADLRGADLSYAHLRGANFRGADLIYARFIYALLNDAYLRGASLMEANFSGASLQNADFTDAVIGRTMFAETNLSLAQGLNSIEHYGPSEISISTLYKSAGNIPESFLRGCGVPDDFIVFVRSLVGIAVEFYSCFISFTEADDAISERLHNDLQAAGVRCWRWKEDAKWGKTLMRSIDEAIHLYDKLIVICSKQSLNSPAVIR